jgi:hypothetical protein
MPELLNLLLAFPTVVYTGLLGLVLLYWIFVIVGALDIESGGGHDALLDAAAAKGEAAGGLMDAAAAKGEAAASVMDAAAAKGDAAAGMLDGDGGLDVDGAADHGLDHAHGDGHGLHEAAAAGALNLRRAPLTVTASFIVFFSWILSFCAMRYLGPLATSVLPSWLFQIGVMIGAFGVSLPLTSLATKPLEGVFKLKEGRKSHELVGTVCRIRSGRVDDSFGQAILRDDGAELIINVRIATGEEQRIQLKDGDSAIIIDYDEERQAYLVEAYDEMLSGDEARTASASRTKR